jgi:hypothetical protein
VRSPYSTGRSWFAWFRGVTITCGRSGEHPIPRERIPSASQVRSGKRYTDASPWKSPILFDSCQLPEGLPPPRPHSQAEPIASSPSHLGLPGEKGCLTGEEFQSLRLGLPDRAPSCCSFRPADLLMRCGTKPWGCAGNEPRGGLELPAARETAPRQTASARGPATRARPRSAGALRGRGVTAGVADYLSSSRRRDWLCPSASSRST